VEEILKHIVLIGVHAAAICAIFAILFIDAPARWPMRVFTIALGLVALVVPVITMYDTLGYPDPWPEPGNYDVIGWKFDEARRAIYAFVKKPDEQRPRLYKVDFALSTALDLQQAREHPEHLARIGLVVTGKEEGPPDIAFEFEKRTVIFSPAEVEERERAAREEREARERQLEMERREDELPSTERVRSKAGPGEKNAPAARNAPPGKGDDDDAQAEDDGKK